MLNCVHILKWISNNLHNLFILLHPTQSYLLVADCKHNIGSLPCTVTSLKYMQYEHLANKGREIKKHKIKHRPNTTAETLQVRAATESRNNFFTTKNALNTQIKDKHGRVTLAMKISQSCRCYTVSQKDHSGLLTWGGFHVWHLTPLLKAGQFVLSMVKLTICSDCSLSLSHLNHIQCRLLPVWLIKTFFNSQSEFLTLPFPVWFCIFDCVYFFIATSLLHVIFFIALFHV